jgi:hypothetical protein
VKRRNPTGLRTSVPVPTLKEPSATDLCSGSEVFIGYRDFLQLKGMVDVSVQTLVFSDEETEAEAG